MIEEVRVCDTARAFPGSDASMDIPAWAKPASDGAAADAAFAFETELGRTV
jgi:hypothetical protein